MAPFFNPAARWVIVSKKSSVSTSARKPALTSEGGLVIANLFKRV